MAWWIIFLYTTSPADYHHIELYYLEHFTNCDILPFTLFLPLHIGLFLVVVSLKLINSSSAWHPAFGFLSTTPDTDPEFRNAGFTSSLTLRLLCCTAIWIGFTLFCYSVTCHHYSCHLFFMLLRHSNACIYTCLDLHVTSICFPCACNDNPKFIICSNNDSLLQ